MWVERRNNQYTNDGLTITTTTLLTLFLSSLRFSLAIVSVHAFCLLISIYKIWPGNICDTQTSCTDVILLVNMDYNCFLVHQISVQHMSLPHVGKKNLLHKLIHMI